MIVTNASNATGTNQTETLPNYLPITVLRIISSMISSLKPRSLYLGLKVSRKGVSLLG